MICVVKRDFLFSLFIFRNLKMRLRDASCKNSEKRFQKIEQALADGRFLPNQNRIKKGFVSESGDCKMTTYLRRFRFWKLKSWRHAGLGWLAGLAGLAGWAGTRFLLLIIKVIKT